MADTVYFLSSREQSRLVSTLNLSKVERLSVQPGQLGDESVELVIEHSLDFLPGTCVDHYALQRGGDAISIQKEFCPGFITKERRTEVVQQTGNSAKWFQLQSPLIFDVKASPKAPSSWGIAKETVKGFSSSEMMWSFANPKIDPLRKLWAFPKQDPLSRKVFEGVVKKMEGIDFPSPQDFSAWRAFAVFLGPMEDRLGDIVEKEVKQQALQESGKLFAKLFQDSTIKPPLGHMNTLLTKTFIPANQRALVEEVRNIINSTYPFMPEGELEEAVKVVTAWLLRRLLFQAGALAKLQEIAGNLELDIELNFDPQASSIEEGLAKEFRDALLQALMDPQTSVKDIHRMQMAYQAVVWPIRLKEQETTLVTFQLFPGQADGVRNGFDRFVSLPTFETILNQQNVLSKEGKTIPLGRVVTLLQVPSGEAFNKDHLKKVKLPIGWRQLNIAFAPTPEKLAQTRPTKGSLTEEAALKIVGEKIISDPEVEKPYFLTTPGAIEIVQQFKSLVKQGMSVGFANSALRSLLKASEGDFLELDFEAKIALQLAAEDFALAEKIERSEASIPPSAFSVLPEEPPDLKSEEKKEEEPIYKKLWGWGIAGGTVLTVGGVVLFANGSDPIPPPPPPDDSNKRGTTTTTGP